MLGPKWMFSRSVRVRTVVSELVLGLRGIFCVVSGWGFVVRAERDVYCSVGRGVGVRTKRDVLCNFGSGGWC